VSFSELSQKAKPAGMAGGKSVIGEEFKPPRREVRQGKRDGTPFSKTFFFPRVRDHLCWLAWR